MPLELDAGRYLEADVRWTLELVPAAYRVRQRQQRLGRQAVAGLGAGRLRVV
jgi:hypothetical protein